MEGGGTLKIERYERAGKRERERKREMRERAVITVRLKTFIVCTVVYLLTI